MANNNTSGIYEIVNKLNGHRYIGSALNIGARWRVHKRSLYNNKHHSRYLQNAWNKHGADAFDFRVIEHCFFFMLIPREQYYIDTLHPEYNVLPTAGSSLGRKFSKETKEKISEAAKGKKRPPRTSETKAKISAAKMGVKRAPFTAEHKARMSAAHIGRKQLPPTTETKAKISASLIGKKHSPEARANMSAAQVINWVKRRLKKELE